MSTLVLAALAGVIVAAISKTVVVVVSLKGVPPKHRAEVLHGVAACLHSWKR